MDAIDKKLQSALDKLNNKQKKAVLGVIEAFAEDNGQVYDHWKDKDFVAEMDRRYNEVKSGKAKLYTLDEVERKAREAAQKIRSRKAS